MNRQQAWRLAVDARTDLQNADTAIHRKRIVELAQAKGYWSVWMTLFGNDSQMLSELIRGFPGTSTDCFGADGRCLPSVTR